jgi:hypothetical protein
MFFHYQMAEVTLMPLIFFTIFFFTLAVLGLNSGLYACKVALYCLSHVIISNLSGLGQNPLLF